MNRNTERQGLDDHAMIRLLNTDVDTLDTKIEKNQIDLIGKMDSVTKILIGLLVTVAGSAIALALTVYLTRG